MLTAARQRRRSHAALVVKGGDPHAGIAPRLHGEDVGQAGLAAAGRAENEGVRQVAFRADVQVQPERDRAVRHGPQQGRRAGRIHRAGRLGVARPNARQRHQVARRAGVDRRPAHVGLALARLTTEPSLSRVGFFDPRAELAADDDLRDGVAPLPQHRRIGMPDDHGGAVVAEFNLAALGPRQRRVGFRLHGQGVLVDRAVSGAEQLLADTADLLPPLVAVAPDFLLRLHRVHVDHALRETVRQRQRVQRRDDVRLAFGREAVDRHHADKVAADDGIFPDMRVLAGDQVVEIGARARQPDAAHPAGGAVVEIVDQFVLPAWLTGTVGDSEALHPAQPEHPGDPVFKLPEHLVEAVDDLLLRRPALAAAVGEKQVPELGHLMTRRQVGDEECPVIFEVRAGRFETQPAAVIDGSRERIGKVRRRGRRIAPGRERHHVRPTGPAGAEHGQRRVDVIRQHLRLFRGAAVVVRRAEVIARDEVALLREHQSAVAELPPWQQIGKALSLASHQRLPLNGTAVRAEAGGKRPAGSDTTSVQLDQPELNSTSASPAVRLSLSAGRKQ